ncbi:hypothetical protein AYI69_g2540, partial [Smittium culicis]
MVIIETIVRGAAIYGSLWFADHYKLGLQVNFPYLRTLFLGSCVYYYAVTTACEMKAKAINDTEEFEYMNPRPGSHTITLKKSKRDYDISVIRNDQIFTLISIFIAGGLHYYFYISQPLIIQMFSQIVGLYLSQFVQVYHLGLPAVGRLSRPWSYNSILNSILMLRYSIETNPPIAEFNDEIVKIDQKTLVNTASSTT